MFLVDSFFNSINSFGNIVTKKEHRIEPNLIKWEATKNFFSWKNKKLWLRIEVFWRLLYKILIFGGFHIQNTLKVNCFLEQSQLPYCSWIYRIHKESKNSKKQTKNNIQFILRLDKQISNFPGVTWFRKWM
jgi:hypothetical protein